MTILIVLILLHNDSLNFPIYQDCFYFSALLAQGSMQACPLYGDLALYLKMLEIFYH